MNNRYLALLATLLIAGCGQAPTEPAPGTKTSNDTPAAADDSAEKKPKREITVEPVDLEGIQAAVAKHKGKVVVMDCWATWCPPCVEEFPKLVEIHNKYGAEKVACISLSFDDPPDQATVLDFLKAKKAHFDNLQTKVDTDVLFKELEIPALPAVFVYGKDGKLVKMADGHKAYEEVVPLVEKLMQGE